MAFKPVRWKTPSLVIPHPTNFNVVNPVISSRLQTSTEQVTKHLFVRQGLSLFSHYVQRAKVYRWIFIALAFFFVSIAAVTTQFTIYTHFYWLLGLGLPAKLVLTTSSLFCAILAAWIALTISPEQEPILHIVRRARKRLQRMYLRQTLQSSNLWSCKFAECNSLTEEYHNAKEELHECQQEFLAAMISIRLRRDLSPEDQALLKERLVWDLKNHIEAIVKNYRWSLTQKQNVK